MGKFLTDDQIFGLRQAHRKTRDRKQADKIKTILSLDRGLTYQEVSAILLLDETTIHRYEDEFKEKGIKELLTTHYIGGLSQLTAEQQHALQKYFVINTPQTVMEAKEYIQKMYKIIYSVNGVTKLLHRLGFVYKKPKVVPGKVDLQLQLGFLEEYEALKDHLEEKDRIYFADSTHPTHNTKISYGWILKGRINDKYVKTTSGRKRLNLNGALNIQDKTAIVLEEKTINTEATIHLLETIKIKQKHGKVYVIFDNAPQHHSRRLKNWLLNHPRFKIIYLPAYSPNLNLIERLWRFFHQKITYNHYFESFKDFREAVLAFFRNLKQYKEELSSLLTDSFQLFPT